VENEKRRVVLEGLTKEANEKAEVCGKEK